MSGIAGVMRRDGREVPEKWVNFLEQSLLLSGNIPYRFEDAIPIQSGNLYLTLLGSGTGSGRGSGRGSDSRVNIQVVDGSTSGECAVARWKQETLELELSRRGTGQKSLYWLDLGEAGDGFVFCSNPLPLLQISQELAIPNKHLSHGVPEYLQLGFVIEGGALLSPVCSIPLQPTHHESVESVSTIECDISPTLAEDVITLVGLLGKPFGDINLLSKLWQYRVAKNDGKRVVDGLVNPDPNKLSILEKLRETHFIKRVLPLTEAEKLHQDYFNEAKRIELGAIASHLGVEIEISDECMGMKPVDIPLSSWLQNPQSSLGQLAGDTLTSVGSFDGLPVEHAQVMELLDKHRNKTTDNSALLFALLTLALWNQLVRA